MSNYSFSHLENLWIQAGGMPSAARMAAAVAMAESGGDPDATNNNGNGSVDRGLWQINSVHGSQSTFDPLANAKAAVAISQNGTTWRPWCTAWSNGLCGGTYLGSGSPIFKYLSDGVGSTPVVGTPGSAPGVQPAGMSDMLNPQAWAQAFLQPIGTWLYYFAMGALGIMLTAGGVTVLVLRSKTFKTVLEIAGVAALKGKKVKASSEAKQAKAAKAQETQRKEATQREEKRRQEYEPRHGGEYRGKRRARE